MLGQGKTIPFCSVKKMFVGFTQGAIPVPYKTKGIQERTSEKTLLILYFYFGIMRKINSPSTTYPKLVRMFVRKWVFFQFYLKKSKFFRTTLIIGTEMPIDLFQLFSTIFKKIQIFSVIGRTFVPVLGK